MTRFGLLFLFFGFVSCGSNNAPTSSEGGNEVESYSQFDRLFPKTSAPFTLTDTSLLNNKDTAQLRLQTFLDFVPDSVETEIFGNKAKVRYTPLGHFEGKNADFYLVKGTNGSKRAALLVAAQGEEFKALVPFLVPDNNAATKQYTQLDKNLSVLRTTTQRLTGDVVAEGKDVFAYSPATSRFDLIMTDPLDDSDQELINPIDTLSRTNKLAGDFSRDKKNLVSVRDGRKPGLITVFIHIEKNSGACTGEIKGDAELTSPTTAVYRQSGDPCVLNIKFGKNNVTLEEQEGCGSRRGIECSFDGTFTRKKETKNKNTDAKKGRR